jgi:hypothetical protein
MYRVFTCFSQRIHKIHNYSHTIRTNSQTIRNYSHNSRQKAPKSFRLRRAVKGLAFIVPTFRARSDLTAPYRLAMRSPLHQSQPLARVTCG